MYYDKQIRYIDYLENGEKKRNCGYVKATVTGGRLLLEMWIRDLYETDDVTSDVVLEGGGAENRIGTVQIRQGSGSFRWECMDREQEGAGMALGTDMRYGQLERIYVQLSPRRSLRCIWRTTATAWENDAPALAVHDTEKVVPPEMGAVRQSESMAVDSKMSDLPLRPENIAADTEMPALKLQQAGQSESMAVDTATPGLQPQLADQSESMAVKSPNPNLLPQPTGQPENMERKIETSDLPPQPTGQPENIGRKIEMSDLPPQPTVQPENIGSKIETSDLPPQPTGQPENMGRKIATPDLPPQLTGQPENIGRRTETPGWSPQPTAQSGNMEEKIETPDLSSQPTVQPENIGRKTETPERKSQQAPQPESMEAKSKTPDPQPRPSRQPESMEAKSKTPDPQPRRGRRSESMEAKSKTPDSQPQPEGIAADTGTSEPKLQSVQHSESIREEAWQPNTPSERLDTVHKQETAKPSQPQRARQTPHMASMSEEKWQQIQKLHPHIRPFQDEREYISLRPEDFVILHSSSYRLVQNSFLLHGYFNYGHLILTCVSQKSGDQYYIGVPGNFFEKEKQVAVMYGFESFECRQEPAGEGEFGYYMIRVEL